MDFKSKIQRALLQIARLGFSDDLNQQSIVWVPSHAGNHQAISAEFARGFT
jgi:hypothetical protein